MRPDDEKPSANVSGNENGAGSSAASGDTKLGKGRRFLKRAAKIVAGTVVVSAVATEIVFLIMFGRTKPVDRAAFPLVNWAAQKGLKWQELEFLSGGNKLRGYLISGEKPRALIMIVHGMNASSKGMEPVVRYFAERDYAVMIFDGTASGRSEGERVVGLQQPRLDIRAAMERIEGDREFDSLPIVLLGHSAGAYGAAAEAKQPRVSAEVCVSGFDSPIGTMHQWARNYAHILGDIQLPFLAAHEYTALGDDANTSAADTLVDSGKPALVIHAANDEAVPLNLSIYQKLEREAPGNVTLFLEDSTGHDSHSDVLVNEKSGAPNTALLRRIDEFLQSVLP